MYVCARAGLCMCIPTLRVFVCMFIYAYMHVCVIIIYSTITMIEDIIRLHCTCEPLRMCYHGDESLIVLGEPATNGSYRMDVVSILET